MCNVEFYVAVRSRSFLGKSAAATDRRTMGMVQATVELSERAVCGLHESLFRTIQDRVPREAPILDLGCGTGAWLHRLRNAGYINLTGVDQRRYAYCTGESFAFRQIDLERAEWSLPKQHFRLVTVIEVIEHIANVDSFLRNVVSVLSDTGEVLVTTPNIHSLAARLKFFLTGRLRQFDSAGDQTHLFPIIVDTFPRLLQRHHLMIKEMWGYPYDGTVLMARPGVNTLCAALRMVLRETVPGDVLVLRLAKSST